MLDLIEAIALGHDLGHVPFGHVGEKFLNNISLNYQLNENECYYVGTSSNPYLCCIGIGVSGTKLTYQINNDTEYILDLECSKNAQINLPYNLKKIFFNNTTSLVSFKIADSNNKYKTYLGSLYEKVDDGYALVKASSYSNSNDKFEFLDDCVEIYNFAFYNIEVENLELPNGLTTIGNKSFYGFVPSLITIPQTLIKIGNLLDLVDEKTTNIILNANNKYYKKIDNMILSYDANMGGEDFAYFAQKVPSAFILLKDIEERLNREDVKSLVFD